MGLVLALCNRIAASNGRDCSERRILDALQIFEAAPNPGGRMGHYRVNANTSAHDAVQGIKDGNPFVAVRDRYLAHPETQTDLIPLPRVGALMVEPLAEAMRQFLGSRLHCDTPVEHVEIVDDEFRSYDGNDALLATSQNLLLCCGARETPLPELLAFRDRWEGSAQFLLRERLEGLPGDNSLIVIIGASHSAFSCAWRLLYDPLFSAFAGDREIVILQRRERVKLRCTPEFAAAHRIDYDPGTDVCPATGLVFRNAGLRKDAKMLYLRIRDGEETRVKLEEMNSLDEKQELLARAGLILQATGFVSNLPPIERAGRSLRIGDPGQCGELHDLDSGAKIPGLFGMGLGINILPDGDPRGEPSFNGGIHGFQSYPLAVAPRIVDRIKANMTLEAGN
jgi:hypothetical protein